MTENDVINMVKDSLDEVNAPNATSSDFDDAILTLVCANILIKNNFFNAETIYPALNAEIQAFMKTLLSLKKSKGELPSARWDIIKFHTDFLLTQLHELAPLQPKIDLDSLLQDNANSGEGN